MFSKEEMKVLRGLNSPKKIQDYLDGLKINFELKGETCMSPRQVLKSGAAHCIEGALLAAAALRIHGYKPLIVDLEANDKDFDHVIAVFQKDGFWGAIGKSNHASLRYRDPIYRDVRELVMSYFHEYFLNSNGEKTLRRFSDPIDLSMFDERGWMFSDDEVWFIPEYLVDVEHHDILTRSQIAGLRKADEVEIEAGKVVAEKQPEGAREEWN